MTEDAVRAQVREILSVALGRPVAPGEQVEQSTEAAWDSVKHVELVLMLEERFGVVFEPEEFAELTSLDECARRVGRQLADRAS